MTENNETNPEKKNALNTNRRSFLTGAATGVAGAALTGGLIAGGIKADNADKPEADVIYPFYGIHQSGVFTPPPPHQQAASTYVALDATAANKDELKDLFKTITQRAYLLTKGGALPDAGISRVSSDSDVIGPNMPADGLTVTLSVGSTLFDDRYGLADKKPKELVPMPPFDNDDLDPIWCGGDLLLQICANHADTVHHALRDILRHTRSGMQMRWRMEGYGSPPRPEGTPRNLLGFKDGTANPTGDLAQEVVWIDPVDPKLDQPWMANGTFTVVRLIRMLVEFWDRVSVNEQERMFGRRRDSGAPLDGQKEFDNPNYANDPKGFVIPSDAHIRLANPRTPELAKQRIIRRSYNYDLGIDPNGQMQSGHIFVCYQRSIEDQFFPIQLRLKDEPLVDYVQPFGGGYFFTLPGIKNDKDFLGSAIFS